MNPLHIAGSLMDGQGIINSNDPVGGVMNTGMGIMLPILSQLLQKKMGLGQYNQQKQQQQNPYQMNDQMFSQIDNRLRSKYQLNPYGNQATQAQQGLV